MDIKQFIEKKLDDLKPTKEEVIDFASEKDLADFIFKTVMSKKFRKFSVMPEYVTHINWAIENSVKNKLPIKFVLPFGGYKLWRLEEPPEVDWAELFTLMYYAKWLKPIAEVYKPGVWFDFCSDDIIVERMNNISKNDTESYAKSFHMVLDFFKQYLPKNMEFTLTPISSLYTSEEFEVDLRDKVIKMEKELEGLPVLDEKRKKRVELNVKLKPNQDNDPLWREKVELLHQAYYTIDRRVFYRNAKEKIIAFSTKMKDSVSVGTTKTSVVKFWVGVGALKKIDDGFIEYVLSPSQLESSNFIKENISIDGLESKNFKTIRLFND